MEQIIRSTNKKSKAKIKCQLKYDAMHKSCDIVNGFI